MDRLQAMLVFTRVVDSGSFSRAADTLDLARASVTVIVQNLETYLKVHLLQRSTRRLSLTPEGAQFYDRCVRILADIDEMEGGMSIVGKMPQGKLRIDTPGSIGKTLLIPALDNFRARYPDIELIIGCGDKPVDLIQEAVDCAIKLGSLVDSSLVARRIGTLQRVTAAAPRYLEHHGVPHSIDDLCAHVCVRYLCPGAARTTDLQFQLNERMIELNLRGSVTVNDMEAYLACGLKGLGIVQVPRFMAMPYLRSGELVEILPDCKPNATPVSVVYLQNRHLSGSARAFVDWIAEVFENAPLFVREARKEVPLRPAEPDHPTGVGDLSRAMSTTGESSSDSATVQAL
ncbi:LysR family transcriptional regulator [Paraburkholderia sp. 1N]|jgi:LysR family transcriptional regulator for bpeEF and oprC|uniref:LysR family transcriptional regulator n=1 Tax=Paraburkholderia solitsugae TaxID=2675748 RepID=A0ABX2BHZ2_9BURK|nr:LysR family transcriptional regulator [Paraburkholderia solitsugae]NPT40537.1 LysR family transcriptional regulator [Paraburkholderia solitsugae]